MDNTANEKLTATNGESCYRRESVYMKFKGIELIEGEESEAELFVNVEISTECDDAGVLEEVVENVVECIDEAFENYEADVYVDVVYDNLLEVRCDEITFDMNGVVLLTDIYKVVLDLDIEDVNIGIGVHIDGEKWFEGEDGTPYNEDVVTLDEFLNHVEY